MSWFEQLRQRLHDAPHPTTAEDRLRAAAVLLLELARADAEHHPAELAELRAGLAREFGVPEATLDSLLADAEARAKASVSLFEFVQTLNRAMTQDEKRALLGLLWRVAYADGRIEANEEHLLRRLSDLLHLSHGDFIRAKHAGEKEP
jgi:uncharacterized tellurite resistance protein B-like protein